MSDPVQVMITYIQDFLEKPHAAFNNLPVCPFVKKARENDKLMLKYIEIDQTQEIIDEFKSSDKDALVLIFPIETTENQIFTLQTKLEPLYPNLIFLEGHPNNNFKILDLNTRREPYPNLVVQYKINLKEKADQLSRTKYYENYPQELRPKYSVT